MASAWQTPFERLLRAEEGNVVILVGIMAFLLIMAVGVAIDMTRAQILQQRMSASLDAAGLAAAETISVPPPTICPSPATTECSQQWANSEAARYFSANFPTGYLGSNVAAPVVNFPNNDLNTLALTVAGTQQPVIMQTFGFSTLSVAAASTITRSNTVGMEVALVLDNTGSMNCDTTGANCTGGSGTKIDGLRIAATQLVNTLFGSGTPPSNVWVGIIPFATAVNVSSSVSGGVFDSAYNNALPFAPATYAPSGTWSGCVTSRSPTTVDSSNGLTYDLSDIPASSTPGTLFQDYFYASAENQSTSYMPPQTNATCNADMYQQCYYNQWQTSATTYNFGPDSIGILDANMGPNGDCPQQVTPMTSSQANLLSSIASMVANGDTEINIGLAWGWRMLSPNWQGLWLGEMASNSLPLPYNTPNNLKVVVLMTDGTNFVNQGSYSAYGFFNSGSLGSGYISSTLGTGSCTAAGADDTNATTNNPNGDCQQAAALDLDARTLKLCNALKAQNIIVYTIGFGAPAPNNPPLYTDRINETLVDAPLLTACAGGTLGGVTGQYFPAANNQALLNAFSTIANQLENIRISK